MCNAGIIQFSQPVLVSREDPNSRQKTIQEIRRRSQSKGEWPQIFIFPEGTCSNRSCLISFKGGQWMTPAACGGGGGGLPLTVGLCLRGWRQRVFYYPAKWAERETLVYIYLCNCTLTEAFLEVKGCML